MKRLPRGRPHAHRIASRANCVAQILHARQTCVVQLQRSADGHAVGKPRTCAIVQAVVSRAGGWHRLCDHFSASAIRGALPVTFYRATEDLPLSKTTACQPHPPLLHRQPLFPFGHGLRYTRFLRRGAARGTIGIDDTIH